jgi:DNA-binding MarR family transcriptional regulator
LVRRARVDAKLALRQLLEELIRLRQPTAVVSVANHYCVQKEVVSQLDAVLQAKHHLPLSSFEVLLHLSRQPERRMRLSALAESVVLTQSGISHLIDRLEQAELVRREPSPGDGRGAYAVLTEEGLTRVRAAKVTHLAAIRAHFLDHLTAAELTTLARV